MTLKIMCTYAHDVTLESRRKMASSHRVTDSSNLQGWSFDAIVSSWAFVYCLLVISSFSNLARANGTKKTWRFSLFPSVYLDLIREPAFYWVFYFPSLSLFVSSYVQMKKFCLFNRLAISWPPWVWGWASYRFLPFTVFSLGLPFCFSSYIVHLQCTNEGASLSVSRDLSFFLCVR